MRSVQVSLLLLVSGILAQYEYEEEYYDYDDYNEYEEYNDYNYKVRPHRYIALECDVTSINDRLTDLLQWRVTP